MKTLILSLVGAALVIAGFAMQSDRVLVAGITVSAFTIGYTLGLWEDQRSDSPPVGPRVHYRGRR